MPLVDLHLLSNPTIPTDVRAFLDEAEHRVERFRRDRMTPAFVPSDFTAAYKALCALEEVDLSPGRSFCEWGSGFGVAACLAAMLGFDACGIEAEEELVDCARRLADDFGLPVQYACVQFPPGRQNRRWWLLLACHGRPVRSSPMAGPSDPEDSR